MAEIRGLWAAKRDRLCPYCGGGLRITYRGGDYALQCIQCHRHLEPDECPKQLTLNILDREAKLATTEQRIAGRSVAQDMADLFG